MISAIAALAHNGRLIKEIERILQDMAENRHCRLYIVNPDGTRVRIQNGVRIESYEWFSMTADEECR